MIKKPEPGDGNATMQIDAIGDLEGVQLDDNEASDVPESVPPSRADAGRATPPPIPAFMAQPPGPPGASAPPRGSAPPPAKAPRNALVYGVVFVVVAIGIAAGVKLGSALRGPAPVAAVPSAAPSAVPSEAPAAAPSAVPPAAGSVMRLDTIEVRDPPADPPK
ncbi:MAG: hypothetical protein ABIP39_09185 [Polyangiaceae bacterium]